MATQVIEGAGAQDIELDYLATANAATAVVEFDGLIGAGDSKRNNGERRNLSVGADLAIGRAFIDLGTELIERAYDNLED
jgi:hypothetical protein